MNNEIQWNPDSIKMVASTEITQLLEKGEVLKCLESAFIELGSREFINPPQTSINLQADGGDTIFYPGAHVGGGLVGVTVSPYLFARARVGLNPVTSFTLLISTVSGLPVGLIESDPLIEARTAATTALAVRSLSPQSENRLSVIGSGPIARAHLDYALHIRKWEQVSIFSPSIVDKNSPKRTVLQQIHPDLQFSESLKECVEGANVIMLCTASAEPVLNLDWLPKTALITSTTTSGAGAHDVPIEILPASFVYCDNQSTTPNIAGEMTLAEDRGIWSRTEILGDLGGLLTHQCDVRKDGLRYFRSVGLGTEEIAIAGLVLDRLPLNLP